MLCWSLPLNIGFMGVVVKEVWALKLFSKFILPSPLWERRCVVGGFCLQLIILVVFSQLMSNHLVTQGSFSTSCDEALKKMIMSFFTSWILIDVPLNNSLISCTSHHPQRLFYVELKWSPNKTTSHEKYPDFQFCKGENCGLNIIHSLHSPTDGNIRLMGWEDPHLLRMNL